MTIWGDPGASGPYIMRCIHNYYKPRVQACYVSEIVNSEVIPYDRIIIVDDFVGSGEQFSDFWENAEIEMAHCLENGAMITKYRRLI